MTAPGDKTDTSSAAENTSSITGTNNNALLASPEDVLTAEEVIERLEELEHDAAEALPGRFDQCTYDRGHVRQPVYACLTCAPRGGAGMCYGCSISCHGRHEVIELFAKRNFRCDCGIGKLKDTVCTLAPTEKAGIAANEGNASVYNHNFVGRYCFCDAIYNSATEQSTFFQCIACEDWFHDRCVGEMPDEEAFEDFVCRRCVDRFPFVLRYVGIEEGAKKEEAISNDGAAVRSESIAADSTSSVNAAITDKKEDDSPMPIIAVTAGRSLRSDDTAIVVHRNDLLISTRKTPEIEGTEGDNTCDTPVDEQPARKKLRPANECLLAQLPPSFLDTTLYQYDLFVTVPIQSVLCKCDDCVSMYTREQCSFFIDEEPTVEPEPDQGANVSSYEAGMQAFDTLDHTTKMNGLASYDRMRESIRGFLLPFAQSQRVVTKEDVQKFFGDKLGSRP